MRKTLTILSILLLFTLLFPLLAAALEPAGLEAVSDHFASEGYFKNGTRLRGDLHSFEGMLTTRPGDEIFLPLETWYFTWEKNADSYRPEMTAKQNQTLNLGLSVDVIEGEEAFDRLTITSREDKLGILIAFADAHPSFEPIQFKAECKLTQNGGEIPGGAFWVDGILRNRKTTVTGNLRTVTLGKGRQAVGGHTSDLADVMFDLGCGVTLTADLQIAQEVYAHAEDTPTQREREVMARYPQIKQVVRTQSLGFVGGRVQLDTITYGKMHVYGPLLNYLGTTDSPLPLERVYYLAAEKLSQP